MLLNGLDDLTLIGYLILTEWGKSGQCSKTLVFHAISLKENHSVEQTWMNYLWRVDQSDFKMILNS